MNSIAPAVQMECCGDRVVTDSTADDIDATIGRYEGMIIFETAVRFGICR